MHALYNVPTIIEHASNIFRVHSTSEMRITIMLSFSCCRTNPLQKKVINSNKLNFLPSLSIWNLKKVDISVNTTFQGALVSFNQIIKWANIITYPSVPLPFKSNTVTQSKIYSFQLAPPTFIKIHWNLCQIIKTHLIKVLKKLEVSSDVEKLC